MKKLLIYIFTILMVSSIYAKQKKVYVWVDYVNIRSEAGMNAQKVGMLREGEAVFLLNKKSDFKTKITLRCKKMNLPWVKIRNKKGVEGWVFKGILSPKKIKNKIWKAIIAYSPGKNTEVSEDWSFFLGDIHQAFNKKGVEIYDVYSNTNRCVKIGGKDYPQAGIDLKKLIKILNIKNASYILLRKGKSPKITDYGPPTMSGGVLEKAKKYFK